MTQPENVAVTDGDAATETPQPQPDPEPSPEHLASVGALVGGDLAGHLGAQDLEAHAAAQIAAGGPGEGVTAPDGAVQNDARRLAVQAWIDNPTYTAAMTVGDKTFSTCDLCHAVVGPEHDFHTETHRRAGD